MKKKRKRRDEFRVEPVWPDRIRWCVFHGPREYTEIKCNSQTVDEDGCQYPPCGWRTRIYVPSRRITR